MVPSADSPGNGKARGTLNSAGFAAATPAVFGAAETGAGGPSTIIDGPSGSVMGSSTTKDDARAPVVTAPHNRKATANFMGLPAAYG